eukprot:1929805-Pyramimonas_sp.AAC.1
MVLSITDTPFVAAAADHPGGGAIVRPLNVHMCQYSCYCYSVYITTRSYSSYSSILHHLMGLASVRDQRGRLSDCRSTNIMSIRACSDEDRE